VQDLRSGTMDNVAAHHEIDTAADEEIYQLVDEGLDVGKERYAEPAVHLHLAARSHGPRQDQLTSLSHKASCGPFRESRRLTGGPQ
jgi:hypothetical protein